MTPSPQNITLRLLLFFLFVFCLGSTSQSAAAVSGQYRLVEGNSVVFDVSIGSPPPSSVIVQHFHPAGNGVSGSAPPAGKVSTKSGYAKWFLKKPQPGTYSFSLQLARPVSPGSVRLILRYKDSSSGNFPEITVLPQ